MCYAVYISTDSPENMAERNSDLVRFERITDADSDRCTDLLDFPNKWYIGSQSICSCTFRQLSATELGFGEPEDWYEEEQDDLDATGELYRTLNHILCSGYQLDLVDRWEGSQPEDITILDVSLDDVSERAFRMFEDYKFSLKKKYTQPVAAPDSE